MSRPGYDPFLFSHIKIIKFGPIATPNREEHDGGNTDKSALSLLGFSPILISVFFSLSFFFFSLLFFFAFPGYSQPCCLICLLHQIHTTRQGSLGKSRSTSPRRSPKRETSHHHICKPSYRTLKPEKKKKPVYDASQFTHQSQTIQS